MKAIRVLIFTVIPFFTIAQNFHHDPAMQTPIINTTPAGKYLMENLDYAMTMGITQTPKGRIWCAFFGGGDSRMAYIQCLYSDDNGTTWSDTKMVIDPHDQELDEDRCALISSIWTSPTGEVYLFFSQSMHTDGRGGIWQTKCSNPDDENPEWSIPKYLGPGYNLNKPTVLRDGRWVLPTYFLPRNIIVNNKRNSIDPSPYRITHYEYDHLRCGNFLISNEQGYGWQFVPAKINYDGIDFLESMVTELDGDTLMVTSRGKGYIYKTLSYDGGITWEKSEPYLPSVNSRHFIRRLDSGRILLVKNGAIDTPAEGWQRKNITAFLSEDNGKTWEGGLLLDERTGVAYPDGFQSKDGSIFISYDYDRDEKGHIYLSRFTEEDILAGTVKSKNSFLRKLIVEARPELVERKYRLLYDGERSYRTWVVKNSEQNGHLHGKAITSIVDGNFRNPDKDTLNESPFCIKFRRAYNAKDNVGFENIVWPTDINRTFPSLEGVNHVSLQMKKEIDGPVIVELENKKRTEKIILRSHYTGKGRWETVNFNISDKQKGSSVNTLSDFAYITVYVHAVDNSSKHLKTDMVVYVDDIKVSE